MSVSVADLMKWIPEQSQDPERARDLVYRMVKKGIEPDTIYHTVQYCGVDEAYFLLMTGLAKPVKRRWWQRLMLFCRLGEVR